MNSASLVQKLWNYCNVLRDDGMSYGDYVEQLTYLLFLKMADERSRPPYNQPSLVPAKFAWPTLLAKDGDELFDWGQKRISPTLPESRQCCFIAQQGRPGRRYQSCVH